MPLAPTPSVSDHSIPFLARQSPGIDLTDPSLPTLPPHPFPREGRTRRLHQVLPLLTTSRTPTQTSSLAGSRYPFPPTQVHDPIRNSTTRTPIPFRCARTLKSWSNAVHRISLHAPPSYPAYSNTLLNARMRSSASCSIIARMIPSVSRIWPGLTVLPK